MNTQKIGLIASLSLLFLSSCSVLSPVQTRPEFTYRLNTVPHVARHTTHPITIGVLQPETSPLYSSNQMAYTKFHYQTAYFAKNSWAEPPTSMLQMLMIETLQNTHYFRAVVSPVLVGNYDYVLSSQLIDLQQDFTRDPSVIRFTMRVQLTRVATNQVIATKQFSVVEVAPMDTPYSGVLAANRAVSYVLKQIADFCMRKS